MRSPTPGGSAPDPHDSPPVDHTVIDDYLRAWSRGEARSPREWLGDRDEPHVSAALHAAGMLARCRGTLSVPSTPMVFLSGSSEAPDPQRGVPAGVLDDEEWLRGRHLEPLGYLDVDGGGMGVVGLAWHTVMKSEVVLKAARESHFEERFRREIAVHAKLKGHPNIATARDSWVHRGASVLMVDYVDGPTLRRRITADGRMPWPEAVDCIRQAAQGLGHAHAKGVVHRDVKSSNLIRSNRDGVVRLIDWGIALDDDARRRGDDGNLTRPGGMLGTPRYCPPEQADDPSSVTPASDLYGLGCVWYELLTGDPPFPGNAAALRTAHAHAPVPPLDPTLGVPERIENLLRKLLEKSPADRYSSADEFIDALDALRQPDAPRSREPARLRWLAPLLLVGIAGAIGSRLWTSTPRPTVLDLEAQIFDLGPQPDHSGLLGSQSFGAREGDQVKLHAKLSAPAYSYVLSFRPDKQMELCLPVLDGESPVRSAEPATPLNRAVDLDNGTGLEAFAVVSSRKPLPPFRDWRVAQGPPPWEPSAAEPGAILIFDGESTRIHKAGSTPRGAGATLQGAPGAIEGLADWLKTRRDVDAVYIKAFTVAPAAR